MPTYTYRCSHCGNKYERQQTMREASDTMCPSCGQPVKCILSGGAGFILKSPSATSQPRRAGGCSLERTGRTCCGQSQRCGEPRCGEPSQE